MSRRERGTPGITIPIFVSVLSIAMFILTCYSVLSGDPDLIRQVLRIDGAALLAVIAVMGKNP